MKVFDVRINLLNGLMHFEVAYGLEDLRSEPVRVDVDGYEFVMEKR